MDLNKNKTFPLAKWMVVVAVVLALIGFFLRFREQLSLESFAEHEAGLRSFQTEHPILVYGLAFLIYVAVTGLSVPGATVLTLAYGWYFGLLRGVILVSFASTTGATIAFLLSRYLLRETIQNRFGDRLRSFNENLQREGAFYLFTLRLIPAVPFFAINVVMGLTPMRVVTFWWVSQVGMLAGTIVYVFTGSTFPSLEALAERGPTGVLSWPTVIAFVMLGLFPLVAKRGIDAVKRRSRGSDGDSESLPTDAAEATE